MTGWPAPGWKVRDVSDEFNIAAVNEMPRLQLAIESALDDIWAQAQARAGGALFNGRVFSADHLDEGHALGHWTEYRRVVAQMASAELGEVLRLRPMAVGGLIVGPDGIVFGQRPSKAVYQAGLWQLPPAGNLDPGSASHDGQVDFKRQLIRELKEELGLTADQVRLNGPLCLVEHAGTHVLDLGVSLSTHLNEAALMMAHSRASDAEYETLRVVRMTDLPKFLEEKKDQVTPQALVYLAKMGFCRP